jgi:hypothetical protein
MLFTAHAAVGGVAGEYLNSPILAFIAGFILHFILDSVPHYDTTDNHKWTFRQCFLMFADMAIGIVLVVVFYNKIGHPVSFFAGALGGVLPDILDITPLWQKQFRSTWFGRGMHKIHFSIQNKVGLILGLTVQAVIIAVSVLILISK